MTVEPWLSHWLDNIASPSAHPKTLAGVRPDSTTPATLRPECFWS